MIDHTQDEVWRPVPGTDDRYEMSSWRRIRRPGRRKDGGPWSPIILRDGIVRITYQRHSRSLPIEGLHRLTFPELFPPEAWKPVPGDYDRPYEVSDLGRFRDGDEMIRVYGAYVRLLRGGLFARLRVRKVVEETHGYDAAWALL